MGPLRLQAVVTLQAQHRMAAAIMALPAQSNIQGPKAVCRGLQAVVTLRAQYRMAADIMALPNALVYSGALAAGSPAVASRCLKLGGLAGLGLPPWLQQVGPLHTTGSFPSVRDAPVGDAPAGMLPGLVHPTGLESNPEWCRLPGTQRRTPGSITRWLLAAAFGGFLKHCYLV